MQEIIRQSESTSSTVEHSSTSNGLRDRLKLIVDEFGSNSSFARQLGVAETTIRRWLNGSVEPKQHSLAGIAAAANVSIEWLLTGNGEMRQGELMRKDGKFVARQPTAEYKASAARVVSGENMEPTLCLGDEIGVEYTQIPATQIQEGIYLIRVGGNEGIWRLQGTPDNRLWLLNDNPKYQHSNTAIDLSVAKDLEIVARVTWVRHKL